MKSLLKFKFTLAISAAATLGSASLFAGQTIRYAGPNEIAPPRMLVTPVGRMKCDTMVIAASGRNGQQVVSCKRYTQIRPDDCRRACANQ